MPIEENTAMDPNTVENKIKLYQKIWAVMEAIDFVPKDGTVTQGQGTYKYATDAALKGVVHPALLKHRLLFLPVQSQIVSQHTETFTDQYNKQKVQNLTTISLRYRFVDVDTGAYEEAELQGSGTASDEKSIYKALTGCLKYIFHLSFVIPTGDDPEAQTRTRQERIEDRKAEQRKRLTEAKAAPAAGEETPAEPWDWRTVLPQFEALRGKIGAPWVDYYRTACLQMDLPEGLASTRSPVEAEILYHRLLAAHRSAQRELQKRPAADPDWKQGMKEQFARVQQIIGDKAYGEVLAQRSLQSFTDCPSEAEAKRLYQELTAVSLRQGAEMRLKQASHG